MKLNGARKTFLLQLLIGGLAVAGFALARQDVLSALWGLGIGAANLAMLGISFRWASRIAANDPKRGMTVLYMSAVIRFILLAVFFASGLALFRLEPMPMVLVFVAMQLGSVLGLRGKRRLTD